jgi:hypothetical protein
MLAGRSTNISCLPHSFLKRRSALFSLLVGRNSSEEPMQPLIKAMMTVVAMAEAKCKRIFTSCYSTKLTLMMMMRTVQRSTEKILSCVFTGGVSLNAYLWYHLNLRIALTPESIPASSSKLPTIIPSPSSATTTTTSIANTGSLRCSFIS